MFQVILLALMGSNNAAREIAGERSLFEKEKFAGLSPLAYVGSQVVFLGALVWARLILREGQGRIAFRPGPLQSAAFVVLKAPDVPSVLFESGYISNSADTARLLSPEGQKAFADATARAIRVYFARQSVR